MREAVGSASFNLKVAATVQVALNGWLSWTGLVYHNLYLAKVTTRARKPLVYTAYRVSVSFFFKKQFLVLSLSFPQEVTLKGMDGLPGVALEQYDAVNETEACTPSIIIVKRCF